MTATHWIIVEERARERRARLHLERTADRLARAALARPAAAEAVPPPLRGPAAVWGPLAGLATLLGLHLLSVVTH
jgi:hypothetical protein